MFNQTRLKFTFVVFFILLAFILFDIFQLQTTEFQSTSDIIDQQNLDKFYITAPRGEIFDANGEKIAETKKTSICDLRNEVSKIHMYGRFSYPIS